MLALLAALLVGFIARRMMVPQAMHYLTHRAPENPEPPAATGAPDGSDGAATNPNENAGASANPEHLTAGDREQLDTIIKRKAK